MKKRDAKRQDILETAYRLFLQPGVRQNLDFPNHR